MEATVQNTNILIYKQILNEVLTNSETDAKHVLVLGHVLQFIHKNINKINNEIQIADVLPVLHHSLHLELQLGSRIELGSFLCALLDSNIAKIDVVTQVIYQILKTLTYDDTKHIQIGVDIFFKLFAVLKNVNEHASQLTASILCCLQLYANKFNAPHIIESLWTVLDIETKLVKEDTTTLQILIFLFDEFSQYIQDFKKTLQHTKLVLRLLDSEEHDHRKFAYFLLKKLYAMEPLDKDSAAFWTVCINIFENLEENQSHLILPSLEQLTNIAVLKPTEENWLDILYRQILRHNNILVRRWILEYLLSRKAYDTMDASTQVQLFEAFNDTSLYNVEGYMLPAQHIETFLICDKLSFFKVFSQIDWKAVPLHFWLTKLLCFWRKVSSSDITYKVLFDLAVKIRTLQNVTLRRENISIFKQLFTKVICEMDVLKYVQLIEALYNVSDPFKDIQLFCDKFENYEDIALDGNRVFSQRFYDILTNQISVPETNFQETLSRTLIPKLNTDSAAKWTHGFLRFLIVFDLDDSVEKGIFCQQHYGLDLSSLIPDNNFNTIYKTICERLACADDEKHFIKAKIIEFILYTCLDTYADVERYELSVNAILSLGTHEALLRITHLLAEHDESVKGAVLTCCMETLLGHLKNDYICQRVCRNLLKHCERNMSPTECCYWMKKLINLDIENLSISSAILGNSNIQFNDADFLVKGALLGEAKIGDPRIEESYECKILKKHAKFHMIRCNYLWHIAKVETLEIKSTILEIICAIANDLNSKKSRYYANSKEHRLMTRITHIFWLLRHKNVEPNQFLYNNIWLFLLKHNNHPNIAIIYESLIASLANFETLFNKIEAQFQLEKCTAVQESCLILLLYRYFDRDFNCKSATELDKVITLLWPFTMGSNFQTRLNAQLVISALIGKLNVHREACGKAHLSYANLKAANDKTIEKTRVTDFVKEIHFETAREDFFDKVQYSLNTAYDEYDSVACAHIDNTQLISVTTTETSVMPKMDVQRKINPTADFLPSSNLISFPECQARQFYVVASLIDKIPNLGGIARTTEVLGLKNLVLDSKAHTTKAEFKNLSMTAEKCLNIVEVKPCNLPNFLIDKRNEGFKIIGAEQTANSCSFVDFVFPSHCVLLLGHEKEGIPPNLLGFLDYAVEIPQFGMVRSLNVHVTGALFMWEYCKQNIVTKLKRS